jgi:hypothetical protein
VSVSLRRDVVILACAISAGIHGAVAPAHFSEGAGAALGFLAATGLLAAVAAALTVRPGETPLVFAALTLGGLIASYPFAVTTGLPLLHPDPEPIDGLAVVTKATEAVGLVTASTLLWRRRAAAFNASANERNPTWTRHGPHARSLSS